MVFDRGTVREALEERFTMSHPDLSRASLPIFLGLLLLVPSVSSKTRPEGVIRLACYSRNFAMSGGGHASVDYIRDPMIMLEPIPVIGKYSLGHGVDPREIRRAARIYFPRTYGQLLENDVTIFQEAPLETEGYTNFEPQFLLWCRDYVIEGGKSLDMYGGDASFSGGVEYGYPSWENTPVADVLPVEMIPGGVRGIVSAGGRWATAGVGTYVEFIEDIIGLARLPWDTAPRPQYDGPLNAVEFRPGSRRIAVAVHDDDSYPLIAYWELGEGSSLAYTAVFGSGGTGRILDWKWYPDMIVYLVYQSAGVPMPENIYLPHVIRERLQIYASEREFAYNYLDFIEKLGGSTVSLEIEIGEIEDVREESGDLYLQGRYEESRDVLNEAVDSMAGVLEEAKKLEGRVLFWIYLIEWFVVVGTLLICGVLLNFLMVRRKLYREVGVTRSGRREI